MKAIPIAWSVGPWMSLKANAKELQCAMTLVNGQCFNWKCNEKGEWSGVVGSCLVGLKQVENDVLYMERFPGGTKSLDAKLRDYFQLDRFSLEKLYATWSKADPRFSEISKHIRGVRLLRQDPMECLISFLCSQNNNISRITGMLAKLRERYGTPLCVDETDEQHYVFPTLANLMKATEQELRDLGFGYRAKYIVASAKTLDEKGGEDWLMALRTKPREEVQESLLELQGVGRKVADCVALFCLDQLDCIPVDTHVWAIANRDYKKFLPKLHETKSITDTVYRVVGDFFRSHFGIHAGWAHSVLFTADLLAFRKHLPSHLWGLGKGEKRPKSETKEVVKVESSTVAVTVKSTPLRRIPKKQQADQPESVACVVKTERSTTRLSSGSTVKIEQVHAKQEIVIKQETMETTVKQEKLDDKDATYIKKELESKVLASLVKVEAGPSSQKKRKRLSEMCKK